MKVLVVAPYPPSIDTNSLWAQAWCQEVARRDPDVRIRVVAAREKGDCLFTRADPAPATPNLEVARVWDRSESARSIERTIWKEVQSFRPDLVHVHFNFFTFGGAPKSLRALARILHLLRTRNVSTLVTLHSVVASPARYVSMRLGLGASLPRWVERGFSYLGAATLTAALSSANMVVLTSREAVGWTRQHTGLPSSVLQYIPLGRLDGGPTRGHPVAPPSTDEPDGRPRVAFLGRITPYKGLDDLVRAVDVLKQQGREIKLRILGAAGRLRTKKDGYLVRLSRLIRTVGNGSVALDSRFVPSDEYERLTEAMDVFVLPFVDDGVISASASVLDLGAASPARLVLTKVPRLSEYYNVRGTYLCPEHDPAALANAIWNAVTAPPVDSDRRERELRPFLPSEIANQYLDAYRAICPVPSHPAAGHVPLPVPRVPAARSVPPVVPARDHPERGHFGASASLPGDPHPLDSTLLGTKDPAPR